MVEGPKATETVLEIVGELEDRSVEDIALLVGELGVALGEHVGGLDHPEGFAQRPLRPELIVDEDRENLQVHASVAQLGQPAVPEEPGPQRGRAGRHGHQKTLRLLRTVLIF